jgi:hypothetical protein
LQELQIRRRRMVAPSPDIRESITRLPRWRQNGQRIAQLMRRASAGASRQAQM